jgi:tetratricopeptide (TPR) repeat protein
MRLPVLFLACAGVAAALAVAPPTLAQPKKAAPPPGKVDPRLNDAKKLFEDGAAAYATGNYDEAIKDWQRSFELSQKPLIFESIANAWERLGDARKAREALARWRDAAPPEERDLLDARIRNLDARVAREDEAAAKAAADQAAREARLQAVVDAPPQRPWLPGAIVAGVGGVAVIAGVVVDVVAKGKRPAASACKSFEGQTLCMSSASDAITQSNRMAVAGDVTWAVGAAAVAAGAVLILVRRPAQSQAPSERAVPVAPVPPAAYLAPAPGGVMLGGWF